MFFKYFTLSLCTQQSCNSVIQVYHTCHTINLWSCCHFIFYKFRFFLLQFIGYPSAHYACLFGCLLWHTNCQLLFWLQSMHIEHVIFYSDAWVWRVILKIGKLISFQILTHSFELLENKVRNCQCYYVKLLTRFSFC